VKCQQPLTQQCSSMSQETGIHDYTAVNTSALAKNDVSVTYVIVKQPYIHDFVPCILPFFVLYFTLCYCYVLNGFLLLLLPWQDLSHCAVLVTFLFVNLLCICNMFFTMFHCFNACVVIFLLGVCVCFLLTLQSTHK